MKLLKTADLREVLDKLGREEITYSKMIEFLNIKANNKINEKMKKLIDVPENDLIPLKILAVKANKDLKNYIQDVLSEHVLKAKK